jgi:histidinol-phosphate aminotransferase
MIRPKQYLREIYRTPHDIYDRNEFQRLDKNEGICPIPKKILMRILNRVTPDFLSTYPQMCPIYKSLSDHLSVEEEYIFVTAGSDAAIKTVFEIFVDPGDEVIISDPSYAMYEVYAHLFRAYLKKITYNADLKISVDNFIKNISEKTKLIALPNPDSPTGSMVTHEEIDKLVRVANDHGVVVLIDEAYYPFTEFTAIDLVDRYPNLIITRTFSKAFGLASIRLGFIVANPEMITWLRKFKPMYEVNAFAVIFGCEILENYKYVEKAVKRTNEGKIYFQEEMTSLGLRTYPSYTNFVHVNVGEENVAKLVEKMKSSGILIKGGVNHETLKKCVRIGIVPKKEMRRNVQIIKAFIQKNPVTYNS